MALKSELVIVMDQIRELHNAVTCASALLLILLERVQLAGNGSRTAET
jgi:hypothetical protein